jgi:hypothetical protein
VFDSIESIKELLDEECGGECNPAPHVGEWCSRCIAGNFLVRINHELKNGFPLLVSENTELKKLTNRLVAVAKAAMTYHEFAIRQLQWLEQNDPGLKRRREILVKALEVSEDAGDLVR